MNLCIVHAKYFQMNNKAKRIIKTHPKDGPTDNID